MTLLAPWAVWFSIIAGAIVALYLLKIKRRRQTVPALDFWRRLAGRGSQGVARRGRGDQAARGLGRSGRREGTRRTTSRRQGAAVRRDRVRRRRGPGRNNRQSRSGGGLLAGRKNR